MPCDSTGQEEFAMSPVTGSNHSRPARSGWPAEDFAALSPAERAKLYREFSQDARRRAERSIEPYKSYCLKIANQFERLAAVVEADLLTGRVRPR